MKAVVIPAEKKLEVREIPEPSARPGEVVITLRAAALNHRDVWIRLGQYSGIKYPCVPGSDGTGVVTALGEGVDPIWKDREVLINPSFGWGKNAAAQGDQFTILGLPREGTLAQKISVPIEQVTTKPKHLSWEEAAALPLAGLTAFRALFARAQLRSGDRVLLTGIGSGVALFALQFARAAGAEVWVTSSSEDKIARAKALGAAGGFNYTQPKWFETVAAAGPKFSVIVDSAGGDGFVNLFDLAAAGGRIVFFGATRGNPPQLPSRKIFWKQLSLLGTTMGSPEDWKALIDFVVQHQVKPVVSDVFPLERASEAFDLMERGGQFGKIVLKIS